MRRRARQKAESTIALINVVFLMLIFFLVAGTIAQPIDPSMRLVRTDDLAQSPPPNAIVVTAQGELSFRGQSVADVAAVLELMSEDDLRVARIVPDRDLPARDLISLGAALRAGGADSVVIVTERGLQ